MSRPMLTALGLLALGSIHHGSAVSLREAGKQKIAEVKSTHEVVTESGFISTVVSRAREIPSPSSLALYKSGEMLMFKLKQMGQVKKQVEAVGAAQQSDATSAVQMFIAILQVAILAFAAFLYQEQKPDFGLIGKGEKQDASLDGEFSHGLLSCCDSEATTKLSVFTLCCGPIRWADSMQMAGQMSFKVAVGLMLIVSFFCLYGPTLVLGMLVMAIVGTMYRQKLRVSFNLKSSGATIFTDCLTWCCCPCCAVVQEARQVEETSM